MSTNAEPAMVVVDDGHAPALATNTHSDGARLEHRPSLTEALTLRRNLLQSLWTGVRQLPRGRRIVLMIRLAVSFAQIVAYIPILALPGSNRTSPSHEEGRVCIPDSLFKYIVVHIVRLALDIPVELYLCLSPHRTRQGRRAGPEARAAAERSRPLGSEYLDIKVGKISTLLGIASLVIFFVGNAIVYSSTECSRPPAEAVPLFWAALSSLIIVYIFIVEIAVLAFLIVCALPLLIVIMRALGLQHRLPQGELHPETGKIDQSEVDKRAKLVYYTPAEEDEVGQGAEGEVSGQAEPGTPTSQLNSMLEEARQVAAGGDPAAVRPGLGSRRPTQESIQSASEAALGPFGRLTRLIIARRRSSPTTSGRNNHGKSSATPAASSYAATPTAESNHPSSATTNTKSKTSKKGKLKYPLHPLPAHRATCPICLCDFEEPEPDQGPEPEPLRLLECGHVMHRSCVDQWLTTVSGRCPVCQKAVIPEMESKRAETTANANASADARVNQNESLAGVQVAEVPNGQSINEHGETPTAARIESVDAANVSSTTAETTAETTAKTSAAGSAPATTEVEAPVSPSSPLVSGANAVELTQESHELQPITQKHSHASPS